MPESGMVTVNPRGDLRCPVCANWLMRGLFDGRVELKCHNKRCAAQLVVEMRAGKPTITILSTEK